MKRAFATIVILVAGSLASLAQSGGGRAVVDGPSYDGQDVTCDLPPQEQFPNVAARANNAGCCVFSAIEMAGLAQGLEQMRGFQKWVAANLQGGGWPERTDDYLAKWFTLKNIKPIPYYQYQGRDPDAIMKAIDRTGRMACITYGYSERYGRPIAHMVNCPGYRKYACVLDNNFVAKKTAGGGYDEKIYEWMSPEELVRRMKLGTGQAWIFVWLTPPPPPPARAK